jgi:hypothetical protein
MEVQFNDCFEAMAEIDGRLSSLRERAINVMRWYSDNPAAVVPPLVVRADMLVVASSFQELDLWMSEGGTMPSAWRERRGDVRPVLQTDPASLRDEVVDAFMADVSPVSVPQEREAARGMLSEWLVQHAEKIEGQPRAWTIRVVDNGWYTVGTNHAGELISIAYYTFGREEA